MKYKEPLKENVFARFDDDTAWALGLITADGSYNISRPNELTLYNTDYELIEKFRKIFNTNKKIYEHKTNRIGNKKVWRLNLSSEQMMKDLKALNAYGNKEERNPFPLVPDIFKWAFIKGLYDGDGNFYKGTTSIAGKKDIIKFVYYWICQQIDKSPNKIYQSSSSDSTFSFQISKRDSKLVWNELLKDCAVVYDSKKVKKVIDYFRD